MLRSTFVATFLGFAFMACGGDGTKEAADAGRDLADLPADAIQSEVADTALEADVEDAVVPIDVLQEATDLSADIPDVTPCAPYEGYGSWVVGVRTLDLPDRKVEVWYPAPAGSEVGKTKARYDMREWLPPGSRFSNPPTIVSRVRQLPGGEWECLGQAFGVLSARLKVLGPHGLRAVLWHQGESDANQKDPTRTLPGHLYGEYLKKIILNSRRASGWEVPWFVAQVSYHVPGDEASPDIRAAQASLWKVGLALPGPDTDALKAEWREANGKGVHFSGAGLREHAARWVDRVAPWLEQQLK